MRNNYPFREGQRFKVKRHVREGMIMPDGSEIPEFITVEHVIRRADRKTIFLQFRSGAFRPCDLELMSEEEG